MHSRLILFLTPALFTLISCAIPCIAGAGDNALTVTVEFHDHTGAPLENAPFVFLLNGDVQFALTDANGVATTQLAIPDDDDGVIAVFINSGASVDLPWEIGDLAADQYRFYTQNYAIQAHAMQHYVVGNDAYTFSLTAHPIVHATLRVVPTEDYWFHGTVQIGQRDSSWFRILNPLEALTIPVRRSSATELYITVAATHVIHLTAGQTDEAFDLGDIIIPETPGEAALDITMQNAEDLWHLGGLKPLWRAVCLVRDDAEWILTYLVDADGRAIANPGSFQPPQLPSVPAGRYFVCPGTFTNWGMSLAFLDAVRAGVDLEAHGVPTVTVHQGGSAEITFDARQARDAIIAATGYGP